MAHCVKFFLIPFLKIYSKWFGTATDIDEQKRASDKLAFLAETSLLLTSSLDYDTTLQNLARLIVPFLADWCIIHIIDEETGQIQSLGMAHNDPEREAAVQELARRYWGEFNRPEHLISKAWANGKSQVRYDYVELPGTLYANEHVKLLKRIGTNSTMVVPILVRERVIGLLSLGVTSPGRYYSPAELEVAEEVARRAGTAIDNARLYREAQKATEVQKELARLRDQFMSIANHELRTPLTAIRGYAQLLQQDYAKEQVPANNLQQRHSRLVDNLNRQTHRMETLINQMLDMSRVQQGVLELNLTEDLNLVELIRRVVSQQQDTLSSHELRVEAIEEEILAKLDETRLEQVLNNLVTNAAKYSPPGKPIIIKVEREGQGEGQEEGNRENVLIQVIDEGYGIAPEHLPHIFDRFYRERTSSNRHVDGLGLGLFISREIIQQHGGQLWVESEVGKGSTFFIRM